MQISYIAPISMANGPGRRYTLWVQGCSIRCLGCMNVDTWDPAGGYDISVDDLVKDIQGIKNLDGVTITGGEPFDQFEPVFELCSKLFGVYSIFLTSGYTLKQIHQKKITKIMDVLDIVCLGPFEKDKICKNKWKGSENQEIIYLTDMGVKQSFMPVVSKEVIIGKTGSILTTGFHP